MFNITYLASKNEVQYTKTRLLSFLKQNHPNEYVCLKQKIGFWILDMKSNKDIMIEKVKASIAEYILSSFQKIFGFDNNASNLLNFIDSSDECLGDEDVETNNVYVTDDVEVDVSTVHSVKGETHVATLYMETSYYNKCESEYLAEQLEGIAYQGKGSKHQEQALRVAYVAMSRPRYLLCMAISKEHYENLNENLLNRLWNIEKVY